MSNYIKTAKELKKLHGVKVSCKIKDRYIEDAKIAVEKNSIYICQNVKDGSDAKDKLGYTYSWIISGGCSGDSYEKCDRNATEIQVVGTAIGLQIDFDLNTPYWVNNGKAVLCYIDDEEINLDTPDKYRVGLVLGYTPFLSYSYRVFHSQSDLKAYLANPAESLEGLDVEDVTIGYEYAKPVPQAHLDALDDPNRAKIEELEATIQKASDQIKELKGE